MMATPNLALLILSGLAIVLAVVIPLLNAIPKLSSLISMRWTCVAVILLIMVGVVVDFEPLADSTRDIALTGGFIIVGSYLLFRTIEKVLANGWLSNVNVKGTVSKGDISATVEVKNVSKQKEEKPEEKSEKPKELAELPESPEADESDCDEEKSKE